MSALENQVDEVMLLVNQRMRERAALLQCMKQIFAEYRHMTSLGRDHLGLAIAIHAAQELVSTTEGQ